MNRITRWWRHRNRPHVGVRLIIETIQPAGHGTDNTVTLKLMDSDSEALYFLAKYGNQNESLFYPIGAIRVRYEPVVFK